MDVPLKLISENEQDRSHAEAWWKSATTAEKLAVWFHIQQEHDEVLDELVSRFAQLAFSEMAEKLGI